MVSMMAQRMLHAHILAMTLPLRLIFVVTFGALAAEATPFDAPFVAPFVRGCVMVAILF